MDVVVVVVVAVADVVVLVTVLVVAVAVVTVSVLVEAVSVVVAELVAVDVALVVPRHHAVAGLASALKNQAASLFRSAPLGVGKTFPKLPLDRVT